MKELSEVCSVRQVPLRKELPDRCIRQIMPRPINHTKIEGCGDCKTCSYDPKNNRNCSGYTIAYTY